MDELTGWLERARNDAIRMAGVNARRLAFTGRLKAAQCGAGISV